MYFLANQNTKKAYGCRENEVLVADSFEKKQAEVELWNRMFGHVSSDVLKIILSVDKSSVREDRIKQCSLCPSSKQTRLPF